MNIEDLLKDPNKAKEVLKQAIENGDKKLAEALIPIVRDPWLTYEYALKIAKEKIKDEWEDIVAQNPFSSYLYAFYVLHNPFPKGEDAISKITDYSYYYAKDVLKGPFPKGEDAMSREPFYAYSYASSILKGPFPKGEDVISKDAYFSYVYARDALNDRFEKGEKAIIDNKKHLKDYMRFLKQIGKLDEFLKDHSRIKIKV
jgi:hypothetical protein